MAISLTGPVAELLVASLNAATLRHDAIANNIANVNTPGYRMVSVDFETQLNEVLGTGRYMDDGFLSKSLDDIKPSINRLDREISVNDLDSQMVELTKNTLHYHTLLKGLQDYGSINKAAIKEGKN